jgi:hypothetical protein
VDGRELWQKEYDISGLKRGKYNFTIRARDAAGNETVDGPYTIMVDPGAGLPVVRVVYPGANAVIRQDMDFLGVANDLLDIDRVMVRLDDQSPAPADGAAYWKFRIDTGSIQEGKHTLYVKAWNIKQGEGPELNIPFVYDKTPPQVEFLRIEPGQSVSGNLKLQGFASDLNGIDRVEFSADGGATFADLKFTRDRRNSQGTEGSRVTFTVPFNTAKVSDGQVFFQLRATDATGLVTTRPYLLYVDNEKPILQIYTPELGEDSLGATRVTGRVYDAVGLSKFSYEWAGETHDIPIRPGDPYWAIDLFISYQNRKPTLRITAVDKNNNQTVLERTFTDKRKKEERTPRIQIDYPISGGTISLQPDQSVFGRIAPGFIPASIIMEGRVEELPAQPGFRISPDMIPPGKNTIRLWAKAEDGTLGERFTLQVNKTQRGEDSTLYPRPSPIVITSHKANAFVRGDKTNIQGHIAQRVPRVSVAGVDVSALGVADIDIINALATDADTIGEAEEFDEVPYSVLVERNGAFGLEYRLSPQEAWESIPVHRDGSFVLSLNLENIGEGLIHAELRTTQQELPAIPLYLPLNRADMEPEILFISPPEDGTPVNGSTTVSGRVYSYVPITAIEYTTGDSRYTPIEMQAGFQQYEFTLLFDFTAMAKAGGAFSVRVTDINGYTFEAPLRAAVDFESDNPLVIFNQPMENEAITGDFQILGLARDDDGVSAVYWRIVKTEASADTEIFTEDADQRSVDQRPADQEFEGFVGLSGEFTRIETTESFHLAIPLSYLSDGEWRIEAFAEDIYGLQGPISTRIIGVSTANPQITLTDPVMSDQGPVVYNRGNRYLRGTAYDANGIQGVWVSMDNGNTFQQAEVTFSEGMENWQIPLNTMFYADGEYALLLRVRDRFGQETMDSALINIDNTPPLLDFQAPYNDQKVGNTLDIAARVLDNVQIQDIIIELMAVDNSGYRMSFRPETLGPVILRTLDIEEVPAGEYNIRIAAMDPAGNTATASRNITKTTEADALKLSFFNPLPGEVHTGVLNISGTATGQTIPEAVQIWVNGEALDAAPVDKYGYFYYQYPEDKIPENGVLLLSAGVETPSGELVFSTEQALTYHSSGPVVSVDSHRDGDFITGRPLLRGRAWMEFPHEQWDAMSRKEQQNYAVRRVMVSLDNGQTFHPAKGSADWQFPLECSELGRGRLPILVRAEFANGEIAIHRVLVTIDLDPPQLRTLSPGKNSIHRDTLYVYGTAGDEYELDSITIDLRPGAGH